MRLSILSSVVILMLTIWRLICSGVYGQSEIIMEILMCDCMYACSAYSGDQYDDCANFYSYNQEPLPRCMCDENYMTAKYRRVHAFNAFQVRKDSDDTSRIVLRFDSN
jgi:hypothetical protein